MGEIREKDLKTLAGTPDLPLYRLVNVERTFDGPAERITVLRNINLTVNQSETLAVVGSSGSGKSTLLQILGTLASPSAGKVFFAGRDLARLSATQKAVLRNRELGFVFQFHHLLPDFNAVENAAMPAIIAGVAKAEALDRARGMLDRVGLLHRADYNVTLLSGGERQRVAIARAVLQNPAVLLADEPTGNLDEHTGRQVADLLLELNDVQKTALVVVTHNPELAARMERRLELKSGELYEQPL